MRLFLFGSPMRSTVGSGRRRRRGSVVSALVRAIVTREVNGGPRAVETETIGCPSQGQPGHGIFWHVQSGMTVAGSTLTISSGGRVKSRE